jgi:hypothetical protein
MASVGRAYLEQRFDLLPVEALDRTLWRYELRDLSRANIEALVGHAYVAETHQIDRSGFRVDATAGYGPQVPGPALRQWPRLAYHAASTGPTAFFVLGAFALICALFPRIARRPIRLVATVLSRGVPEMSPRALAAFRLAFGLSVSVYLWSNTFYAGPAVPEVKSVALDLTDHRFLHWLAQQEGLVNGARLAAVVAGLMFAIGIRPRLTYALTTAGALVWMWACLVSESSHPHSVLMLPLLALLTVRWQDAPPLYRRSGAAGPVHLGYAPWLLCLALGVAFAAAAWSKVRDGPGWITTGSAKYAWVADADVAVVEWGQRMAARPRLAVALSAAAVTVEALVVTAAFVGGGVRLAIGVAALTILLGFYLLQGVLWLAWWILLLGFVPWQWVDRGAPVRGSGGRMLTWPQACWGALIVAQQIAVSAAFIDIHPVASRYDMYATTHDTTDDFGSTTRRLMAVGVGGRSDDISTCAAGLADPTVQSLLNGVPAEGVSPFPALAECVDGPRPLEYRLVADRRIFDWTLGRFRWDYRDRLIARVPAAPGS